LGGDKTGPSPVDRSRSGCKHHLIACGRGTPLQAELTGGNRNDITQMIPLVDAIPPVRGKRGRPRRRPNRLYGDRAYHSREGRSELRRRYIQPKIPAPKTPHGSGLGTKRWVVERTIAWLHQYRRLRIRTAVILAFQGLLAARSGPLRHQRVTDAAIALRPACRLAVIACTFHNRHQR
jgi:transposase